MNIAELFVKLGVKGSDKAIGDLGKTKSLLKDASSNALLLKGAMVGAFYGLQQLFASSNVAGTTLTNFNAALGVSTKTLQEYQYAARQVGGSNEEMLATFSGLQNTAAKILTGEARPAGLARVSEVVGGLDIKQAADNPAYLIQKLQEYAKNENRGTAFANQVLSSFGVSSPAMLRGLREGIFNDSIFSKAPKYSERETKALDRANAAWRNLMNSIEMSVGHFNAAYGGEIVGTVSSMIRPLLDLAGALVKLSDALKLGHFLVEGIKAIAGALGIFTTVVQTSSDLMSDDEKKSQAASERVQGWWRDAEELHAALPDGVKTAIDHLPNVIMLRAGTKALQFGLENFGNAEAIGKTPKRPLVLSPGGGGEKNVTVNQTNNFSHPGVDPVRTSQDLKSALKGARVNAADATGRVN